MKIPHVKQPNRFGGFFYSDRIQILPLFPSIPNLNERHLYVFDDLLSTDIRTKIQSNITIFSTADFALRESVVRAQPVCQAIEKWLLLGNLTSTLWIEMTWAVRSPSGDIYLRELQEAFQNLLQSYKGLTIICLYNETLLLEEQLWQSILAHPHILSQQGTWIENPHFIPAMYLRKNQVGPRYRYWIDQLDPARQATHPSLPSSYAVEHDFSAGVAQSSEGRWKIRCFGDLRIHRENGELIDWSTKAGATRKIKTLFAYLLSRGERGAQAEELADLLWPDADDSDQALNRLYHVIRYLRIVLGGPNEAKKSSFILHQGSSYTLRLPVDSWVDLPMFQELCFKGNQFLKEGQLDQVRICYESAERLYSGPIFQDIPTKYLDSPENDWLWSRRLWYQEMYLKLLHSLAGVYRQMGDLALSLKYCDKALAVDPSLEAAHREKLLTLAASERWDALHRQYRVYLETQKKFNAGQPSHEIRLLYLNLSKNN